MINKHNLPKYNKSFAPSVIIALLFVGCMVYFACTQKEEPNPQPQQAYVKPIPISVDILSLYTEYRRNEVRADETYRGKLVRFTGKVHEIGKDFTDGAYLKFNMDAYGLDYIQCFFDDNNGLSRLNSGDQVTVEGYVNGMTLNEVLLSHCYLQ